MLDLRRLRSYVVLNYTENGFQISCITPDGEDYKNFWRKSDCAKYIRANFCTSDSIYLLKRLKQVNTKPIRDKVENTHFKKGITYVGLCEVAGGKMWHCIKSVSDHSEVLFSHKREVVKYINNNFEGEERKYLISQLGALKGKRANVRNNMLTNKL